MKKLFAARSNSFRDVRGHEEIDPKAVLIKDNADRCRLEITTVGAGHFRAHPFGIAWKFALQCLLDTNGVSVRGKQCCNRRRIAKSQIARTDHGPRLAEWFLAKEYVDHDLSRAGKVVEIRRDTRRD